MKRFILWQTSFEGDDQKAILQFVSHFLFQHGLISDVEGIEREFERRENKGSTVLADNLAIPHAQNEFVKQAVLVYLRLPQPVIWHNGQSIGRFIFVLLPEYAAKSDMLAMKDFFVSLADVQTMEWLAYGTRYEVSKIINGEMD